MRLEGDEGRHMRDGKRNAFRQPSLSLPARLNAVERLDAADQESQRIEGPAARTVLVGRENISLVLERRDRHLVPHVGARDHLVGGVSAQDAE